MPTYKSYITGFLLSILLTVAAYLPVLRHMQTHHRLYTHDGLIITVLVIAVLQLLVQMVFFLHIGLRKKDRWNLGILISTISIVLLVVVGSVWIMHHLNYNMTPAEMNNYLKQSESF